MIKLYRTQIETPRGSGATVKEVTKRFHLRHTTWQVVKTRYDGSDEHTGRRYYTIIYKKLGE